VRKDAPSSSPKTLRRDENRKHISARNAKGLGEGEGTKMHHDEQGAFAEDAPRFRKRERKGRRNSAFRICIPSRLHSFVIKRGSSSCTKESFRKNLSLPPPCQFSISKVEKTQKRAEGRAVLSPLGLAVPFALIVRVLIRPN